MAKSLQRQSNIELLRIIAMSAIVIYHFFIHGGIFDLCPSSRYLLPLMIFGVDLFILISGYFSIQIKYKSVLKLFLTIIVFQIVNFIILLPTEHSSIVSTYFVIYYFLAPFSHSPYWFIQLYLILLVISPILNEATKNTEINKLRKLIIVLSILEFYSCWLMGNRADQSGYSLFNFIYLYSLGRYINKESFLKNITNNFIISLATISLIVNLTLNALIIQFNPSDITGEAFVYKLTGSYSNPFTIIFCCCLLIGFSRIKYTSKIINSIASASIGTYLLQDGLSGFLAYRFQKNLLNEAINGHQDSISTYIIWTTIIFICLWVFSWIISRGVYRLTEISYPILNRFSNKMLSIIKT